MFFHEHKISMKKRPKKEWSNSKENETFSCVIFAEQMLLKVIMMDTNHQCLICLLNVMNWLVMLKMNFKIQRFY